MMKNQPELNDADQVHRKSQHVRASMLGRAAIAVLCWGPIVDVPITLFFLGDSHLGDPTWPLHARFHLIWALTTPVIVSLALFYLVLRHWQRLSNAVRGALCVIVGSWYLGEALSYFVIAPLYYEGDLVPHQHSYLLFPVLKTALLGQALLAVAVALAYLYDRKNNPAPVSSVGGPQGPE
jgi:hypothetical protein